MKKPIRMIAFVSMISSLALGAARAATVDFEDISVPTDTSLSSELQYTAAATPTGGELVDAASGYSTSGGTLVSPPVTTFYDTSVGETYDMSNFTSGGVQFPNAYGESYGDWYGWSISSVNNVQVPTASDYTNNGILDYYTPYQNSAYTVGSQPLAGGGAGGSGNYAVFYSYGNTPEGTITLPPGTTPVSVDITNATYTALSAKFGDQISPKFDDPTLLNYLQQHDPAQPYPFLDLTITGLAGGISVGSTTFHLADYTPAAGIYVMNQWTNVSLGWGGAQQLQFSLTSNVDFGDGPTVPFTFAADNLVLVSTPEPSSLVLTLIAGMCAAAAGVRRRTRRTIG